MVKSISTIYIESEVLNAAKLAGLPISQICEEALKLSVQKQPEGSTGSVEGALGNFLNAQAEKNKDIQTIRKLGANRERDREGRFNRALKIFCEKYGLDMAQAIKVCGL